MSMRKSNWSDLLSAFDISERDNVLRLFESAIMKAREVISAMKTAQTFFRLRTAKRRQNLLSQALQNNIGAARKQSNQ